MGRRQTGRGAEGRRGERALPASRRHREQITQRDIPAEEGGEGKGRGRTEWYQRKNRRKTDVRMSIEVNKSQQRQKPRGTGKKRRKMYKVRTRKERSVGGLRPPNLDANVRCEAASVVLL